MSQPLNWIRLGERLFLVPTVFILVTEIGALPLVPFLTMGRVGSEGLFRYLRRQPKPRGEEPSL